MFATLLLSVSLAADPTGIRLPELTVPTPMPTPVLAVSRLAADEYYVVDSDVPLIVLASPEGFVSITEDVGPLKLKGKFADGAGKIETRTYKGKHVFTVDAVAVGKVELLIVPVGGDAKSVIRRTLEVTGARPPPDCPPPPVVDPPKPPPVVDPPVPPKPTVYYFLVVRPDGPASPAFTKTMSLPAWTELRKAGHSAKDKTLTEAVALGVKLPDGTTLPVVVTLQESADKKSSKIVRPAVALPTTDEAILDLPKGVK